MKVLYSNQPPFEGDEKSIFLAGPTPRDENTKSWRPLAFQILNHLKYDGTVLYPEWSDLHPKSNYEDQVEWEYQGLCRCTNIVFWVPRNLSNMPAFTTNIEFGFWMGVTSETGISKVIYGRPEDSPKNAYLDWMYDKFMDRKPYNNLSELLLNVVKHQSGE